MQIEIKLRLPDQQAHHKVMALLEKDLMATHHQENYFFDGAKQEITSTRTVLRCRFYNKDEKALLTCKVCMCPACALIMVCTGQQAEHGTLCRGSKSWSGELAVAVSWRQRSTP